MPDVKDFAPNNPVHQKESPQPKYKTLSFVGQLEDDLEEWYPYKFTSNYSEHDCTIRIVEASIKSTEYLLSLPVISQHELQNILRIDIREELNTYYSIIFETQIELK